MQPPILIVPGLGGSGPDHWQSIWQDRLGAARFQPRSWDRPDRADWQRALAAAVAACPAPPVLVAHSLGCHAAADLLHADPGAVAAALLVAPPDPDDAGLPDSVASFLPIHRDSLGTRAVLVGSSDDPYASMGFTTGLAAGWGVPLVAAGALGHINADSGIGPWDAGRVLLDDLVRGL